MENTDFDTFLEKINDLNEYDEISFDVSYIDNSNNKQSKLIKNEDTAFAYELKNKQYHFKFRDPLFISTINIKSKADDLKGMVVEIIDYLTNDIIRIPLEKYSKYQYIAVKVNKIITSFTIIPPENKQKIELSLIEINGFELEKLKSILESYRKHSDVKKELTNLYSKYKTDIEEKEAHFVIKENETKNKLDELIEEIEVNEKELESLNEKLIDLKSSIKSDEVKSKELIEKVTSLANTKKDLEEKSKNIQNNIEERESEVKTMNAEISALRIELKKLNDDKSLMAYELKDFVSQANTNIMIYLIISVVLIAIIAVLTYSLFNGAANLTMIDLNSTKMTLDTNVTSIINNKIDVGDILLSRLPFVMIITTIIIALYELSKIFIQKSMSIQNQKMNLSKIGIISKDVSDTSSDGLTLTDEEKYEFRTKLKMDILKEYLKKDIDMEFNYSIHHSLLSKVKHFFKQAEAK